MQHGSGGAALIILRVPTLPGMCPWELTSGQSPCWVRPTTIPEPFYYSGTRQSFFSQTFLGTPPLSRPAAGLGLVSQGLPASPITALQVSCPCRERL